MYSQDNVLEEGEMLRNLLLYFNDKLDYVLLSYLTLFPLIESDVDLYVHDATKAKKMIFAFCKERSYRFVQCYPHATGECCFIANMVGDKVVLLRGPDLLRYLTWKNKFISVSFTDLVTKREFDERGYFRMSQSDNFLYCFIKRIDKGSVEERHFRDFGIMWRQDSAGIEGAIRAIFAQDYADIIIEAVSSESWTSVISRISEIRDALPIRRLIRVERFQWIVVRTIRRLFQPCGLSIAFLGPDGSGKTSVMARVLDEIAPAFRRTRAMHLRPGLLLQQDAGPITDPHSQAPRGLIFSIVKIAYWLGDYVVGWWVKVRPMLVRSTLVGFDRYYHDLLVDPQRYRYGGPMWLARLVGRLIPSPDLWIILDAPAEVFQARKQEVPPAETARQRDAYRALAGKLGNAVVVDASQPLDAVVTNASRAILTFMADRTRRRYGQ